MNKSALKKYAPQARLDFIAAVTRRAELLGLNPKSPAKVEKQGDALLINGKAFAAAYAQMRTKLEARIRDQGFAQVMEAMAYTWFNRLVAIRYMELHGFLDHGYRVLSHPANAQTGHTQPEILDHIAELELPGLNKSAALELKLAGNKDEELYREVLLAQCHALHTAMPFLFEPLDDATELLLPDGLLRTDSLLAPLVTKIDEADWQEVEIIGWLYQFYISEKKDQVIGKVVKSEDIPAATQLFTPNWIVKYLVQNSLGRLWLMANPTSTLATKWEYYIKPAEQTQEVNAQLDALIQTRITEDGATLNPESLTLLDPACGSGHILVEAYDLLRDIYLERGYRRQDIPRLILEKNLYGLDIDDRAAQLAGFALLMKARVDDRRLFGQPVALHVLALQEAKEGSAEDLHGALNAPQISYASVAQLVETFELAKTLGSLIQISDDLANALPHLRRELEAVRDGGDMLGRDAAEKLLRLVEQAEVLIKQFDAVVANPPYMGFKGMNAHLKAHLNDRFPEAKADLFAAFIARNLGFAKSSGHSALVTMHGWMFLPSFEDLRDFLGLHAALISLAHLGPRAFEEISGEIVQTGAFVHLKRAMSDLSTSFCRVVDERTSELKSDVLRKGGGRYDRSLSEFSSIPGKPIAYWLEKQLIQKFSEGNLLHEVAQPRQGMATADNERFLRYWHEVDVSRIGFGKSSSIEAEASGEKWFPYNKGGRFRKWYGNNHFVVNWSANGLDIKSFTDSSGRQRSAVRNETFYFRKGITWTTTTSSELAVRLSPTGFLFDVKGSSLFPSDEKILPLLGFLGSKVADHIMGALNPTMEFQVGNMSNLPILPELFGSEGGIAGKVERCVELSKANWDQYEVSWDFQTLDFVPFSSESSESLPSCLRRRQQDRASQLVELEQCEISIDRYVCDLYEMTDLFDGERASPWVQPDCKFDSERLISFAIGCMMGRYSLDAPGLIYAHAGNEGFDPSRYETFPADDDGIVPITDEAWFDDDGANRIREFVCVAWGEETEAENMAWLAESLGSKASESADDTIRRYLSRDFYKDHLQTYKKRPIYWLFSSGKHKAFEALVYLHRYNAGTLSRMRMEYVVPLQSRMQARIDNLEQDIQSSTSSAEQKRFQKQKDKLIKQLDELRRYDENLRHYADQRITLDLDDGVKVNYGKFGDLLAQVKAVAGNK